MSFMVEFLKKAFLGDCFIPIPLVFLLVLRLPEYATTYSSSSNVSEVARPSNEAAIAIFCICITFGPSTNETYSGCTEPPLVLYDCDSVYMVLFAAPPLALEMSSLDSCVCRF